MKTFLINLDKNTDRLDASKRQLDEFGVEFERVTAVYGKELTADVKRASVNRFRWWCARGYAIRDGEIGCALSHLAIYRKIVNEKIPVACVLEDDVLFHPRFGEALNWIENTIDSNRPQVVTMIGFDSFELSARGFKISQSRQNQCTAGYVLTYKAAAALIKLNFPIEVPADSWQRWRKRGAIEFFELSPFVCGQMDRITFGSDVETKNMLRVCELSPIRFVIHKIKRCIGCTIDRILPQKDFR